MLFQDMILSRNKISLIHPFALTGLHTLQYLDISHNQLTSAPSISCVKRTLLTLDLSWNYIKYVSDTYFDYCNNIRNIHFVFNQLTAIPLVRNVSRTLQSLHLGHNNISDAKAIYGVYFPVLVSLFLESNKIGSICLPPLNFVPNLYWLYLSSNDLSRIHFPWNDTERPGWMQIILADNPWNCKGSLGWTHHCKPAIRPTDMICMGWLLLGDMICASPLQVQGRTPKGAGRSILLHWINIDSAMRFCDFSFAMK